MRVGPSTVGYHLVVVRRQDPGLEAEHQAAAGAAPAPHPFATDLARAAGWRGNLRDAEDEARWHHRLAQLEDYRHEGNDWPRHKGRDSKREHTLGVWSHTQRYKHRRGDLDPVKAKLLDAAVPGRQAGWTRGRTRRR